VTGREHLGVEGACAIEKRGELQIAVAMRTWNRRAATGILPDEIGDHMRVELRFEIQDVVGNADR
jgi:hypothetical protein